MKQDEFLEQVTHIEGWRFGWTDEPAGVEIRSAVERIINNKVFLEVNGEPQTPHQVNYNPREDTANIWFDFGSVEVDFVKYKIADIVEDAFERAEAHLVADQNINWFNGDAK